MHFFLDLYIVLVYIILMIKDKNKFKNEMFEDYYKLKSFDEKIEYVKSIRDVDVNHTLNIEYNNIITKLYSDKQSQQ